VSVVTRPDGVKSDVICSEPLSASKYTYGSSGPDGRFATAGGGGAVWFAAGGGRRAGC
jgi:hypothetical protein